MEIRIDSQGLSAISAAGQAVTLMRYVDQVVDTSAVTENLTVAWQAFQPLQLNTVNWTDQYYCFASTTPLVMNAVIAMNAQSASPVQLGVVYQFAQGQFTLLQQQGTNYYIVHNATQGLFAFGLAQSATVNSQPVLAPLCAVPVLYNEQAYFSPSARIGIFLSSAGAAGTLLPAPANPCLVAAATGSGSGPTIGFDDPTNSFYLVS